MMQLFCTNEDMNRGLMKDSSDVFLGGSNESNDSSPPYRSRCNTWPKLVRGLTTDSDISNPSEESWGGGTLLPLVSEETDELSEIPLVDANSNPLPNTASDNSPSNNSNNNELNNQNGNNNNHPSTTPPNPENSPMSYSTQQFSPLQQQQHNHATSNSSSSSSSSATVSTRRNPWGNCSYADLITQAIQSSPDQRLTVSQIYEWLVKNISFFSDKGDSNSSAGWKNSIRHNLSLHPKFVRVQNEGTGKSSWWIINPDVKPGVKPSRRRAMSMETSSARQRKNNLGAARSKRRNISGDHHFHHLHHSTNNSSSSNTASALERTLSSGSLPPYDYSDHSDQFRPRASSSASSCGLSSSPRHNSSSGDILNSGGLISSTNHPLGPWGSRSNNNGSSLSPTLFNVVEKLNLQDSMDDASSEQSGDNLENIKLNDLNLDYETTKLLDSFLSPASDDIVKSEALPSTTQQKIKILEQRDSNSRGSSMSTSTPSSPPGMPTYSCSFIPQPKIEEGGILHTSCSSSSSYYGDTSTGGGPSEMMDTFSSHEEQSSQGLPLGPSSEIPLYSEQFKSFGESGFFGGGPTTDNSYIQGFSLAYFSSSPEKNPSGNPSSNNNNSNNLAQVTLNSY
ncbi:uncharacterized protein [Lepeophtheirus salmonis]|uniref:uncharacterized protein n=1 Tax=Lepeophtheirus salmonis TaxID=72036 RepID=UPI001AE21E21|nr:forkhead box protein O1-like [Lepeophtheirus salmonis]